MIRLLQDFNKLIAFGEFVFNKPLLANVFIEKYDLNRYLVKLLKGLEIDPDDLRLSEQEELMMKAALLSRQAGMTEQGTAGGSPPNAENELAGEVGMSPLEVPIEGTALRQPGGMNFGA